MGRDKKQYRKTLHQQVYARLNSMMAIGESKHEAKKNGDTADKIYSYSTYNTYKQWSMAFVRWIKQEHPNITTMKKARRYVPEYLTALADPEREKPYSAATLATATAALNKLYQLGPDDPHRFTPPERHRVDITRSRQKVEYDKHFSEANHAELVEFARATGARRSALERLTGANLWRRSQMAHMASNLRSKVSKGMELSRDEKKRLRAISEALEAFPEREYFVNFIGDKGGRDRFAPVVGSSEQIQAVVERFSLAGKKEKVWLAVPAAMDVHSYRADYATALYREYARPIDEIPYDRVNAGSGRAYQSEVYHCRGDLKGVSLDKVAMRQVSVALGHNRLEVVASHYIRNV